MMTGQFCVGLWRLKCWSLVLMSQYFHFSKQNNIFCQYAVFSCVLGRFADFLGKCIILMKIFLLYTHVCGRSKVESPSLDVSEGPAHSYPWEGYPPSVHQPQSDTTPAPPATPTYANLFTWRDDRCDLHQSANTVGGADVREQINPPTASITLLLFTTHVELINIDMMIWSEILDPQPFIEIYLLTPYSTTSMKLFKVSTHLWQLILCNKYH